MVEEGGKMVVYLAVAYSIGRDRQVEIWSTRLIAYDYSVKHDRRCHELLLSGSNRSQLPVEG